MAFRRMFAKELDSNSTSTSDRSFISSAGSSTMKHAAVCPWDSFVSDSSSGKWDRRSASKQKLQSGTKSPYLPTMIFARKSASRRSTSLTTAYDGTVFSLLKGTRKLQNQYRKPKDRKSQDTKLTSTSPNNIKSPVCNITLKFLGCSSLQSSCPSNHGHLVSVFQQCCGGNPVNVYRERLQSGSSFNFTSKRRFGFPFSIVIYVDSVLDLRVSTCCEYKHRLGCKLGGFKGHFVLQSVTGSFPCYRCQVLPKSSCNLKSSEKAGESASSTTYDSSDQEEETQNIEKKMHNLELSENYEDDFEDEAADYNVKYSNETNISQNGGCDAVEETNPSGMPISESIKEQEILTECDNLNSDIQVLEDVRPNSSGNEDTFNEADIGAASHPVDDSSNVISESNHSVHGSDEERSVEASSNSDESNTEACGDSSEWTDDDEDDVVYQMDAAVDDTHLAGDPDQSQDKSEWVVALDNSAQQRNQWKDYRHSSQVCDSSDEENHVTQSNCQPSVTVTAEVHATR